MTNGIDTDFLVALEIEDHAFHKPANELLSKLLRKKQNFALAPQVLIEFIHVVTDKYRMKNPLSINNALTRTELWWQAEEVVHVFPTSQSAAQFLNWMQAYRLGRRRLLNTMLGTTYFHAGIPRIITNNHVDYQVFGELELINYKE